MSETTGTEMVKRENFETADLRSISTFEDALSLFKEQGVSIEDATDAIGDGFEMLEDKEFLVKRPFLFVQWTFTHGDFGDDYMIARVVADDGGKYVITDGSTGLYRQVREYEESTGKTRGLLVKRGLRKSEYFLDGKGQPSAEDTGNGKGSTYYLNV
jgi:hypothetical protein